MNPLEEVLNKSTDMGVLNPGAVQVGKAPSAVKGAAQGALGSLPGAGLGLLAGGPAVAAAAVLGGLMKGIFGAKTAQKNRASEIARQQGDKAMQISQASTQKQNEALESLMRSL